VQETRTEHFNHQLPRVKENKVCVCLFVCLAP
jgi:hypothetical protein